MQWLQPSLLVRKVITEDVNYTRSTMSDIESYEMGGDIDMGAAILGR